METRQHASLFHEQVRKMFSHPRFLFESSKYPTSPGCYLMKDQRGDVIYVGKAINLRDRLSSYFHSRQRDEHVARLVARIADVEVILVTNERESLVLENNLIKHYQPRFNRRLVSESDGYSYMFLTGEPYPRLLGYRKSSSTQGLKALEQGLVRQRFGPFMNGRYRDVLLEYVNDTFGLRTCEYFPARACLRLQIRRCCGPCEGQISVEDYARSVEQAVEFLSRQPGDGTEALIAEMKQRMEEHAARLQFELAGRIRDQVAALESTLEKQSVERFVPYDQDVLYFGGRRRVLVMELKRGAVLGVRLFELTATRSHSAACEAFLRSRYPARKAYAWPELIAWPLSDGVMRRAQARGLKIAPPANQAEQDLLDLCVLNHAYRADFT